MTPLELNALLEKLERHPSNVSFSKVRKLCDQHFGQPRQSGSHLIYSTTWAGDPRVNIQNDTGKAKAYQVKQVVAAIRKLQEPK